MEEIDGEPEGHRVQRVPEHHQRRERQEWHQPPPPNGDRPLECGYLKCIKKGGGRTPPPAAGKTIAGPAEDPLSTGHASVYARNHTHTDEKRRGGEFAGLE